MRSAVHDHHVSVPVRGDVRRRGPRADHVPRGALDGDVRAEARRHRCQERGAFHLLHTRISVTLYSLMLTFVILY